MPEQIEWKLWSIQQILDALPRCMNLVKNFLGEFPEEHRERNRAVIESLENNKPTSAEMRDEARSSELITLGYALDYLATTIGKQWRIGQRLPPYQWAHELFRGGKPLQPTKPMRQVVNNAWRAILLDEMQQIQDGTTDAGLVLDQIRAFVVSAWGTIPSQLTQSINEMMLINLERIRAEREDDRMFHQQFVQYNIEAVLSLEVPTRLERVQDRWLELGEHFAPTATRSAMRKSQRPRPLSSILDSAVWEQIKQALGQGDADALFRTLEQVEDRLENNLRLRLNARPEYQEPASAVRYRGQPDRFFDKARALLLKNQAAALDEFRDMHFKRSNNSIIKEWYAYALSKFGKKTDIHEIIDLLDDAINLPDYRADIGWTARWNLACALRQLPPRSDEALECLLPVLDNDTHTTDAFELCLLWALDQKRADLLPELLIKSPYYEAHLLATRDAIEGQKGGEAGEENGLGDYYRRLNAIVQNPDYAIPDAKEELRFAELDKLMRHFTESLLIDAGIEWFRQRLSYGGERYNWKNWESLARLSERAGDMQSAWRYMRQQWNLTVRAARITPEQKTSVLRNLMNWAGRYGFEEDALRVLKQNWKSTSLTEADVHLLELRWRKTSPGGAETVAPPAPAPAVPEKAAPLPPLTLQEADSIVQRVSGLFQSVRSAGELVQKSADAQSLIAATIAKDPSLDRAAKAAIEAMRAVIRLAGIFNSGVDDQGAQELSRQMREQLAPLQAARQSLPFYIVPLAQACERIIQYIVKQTRDVPEIQITSLESLKVALDRPSPGETYQTRIFARLTNPGKEEIRDINLAFIPQSSSLHFKDASLLIPPLGPGEKRIVEGVVEVSAGVEDKVPIQIHVSYKSGGVMRAAQIVGQVPVRPLGQPIPYAERYMTGRPVSVGRADLFHGRSKELKELLDTFAGGRLLKLYFVNGIRRVGKSTLMEQLAGSCGPDILPLVLNLQDVVQEDSNSIQLVNQLIREAIEQVQNRTDLPPLSLVRPGMSAFELDPPWVVFEAFL
ncbi:MAG TPA: hypothetical protein VIZ18_11530, partial [Ktedonobacteraceae bacterium]